MSGKEIDDVTGVETTGHEWDGIKELNKPLPKWWLWVLYATIVWAIGYWILMPSWPLLASYSTGVLGYSQRSTVAKSLSDVRAAQAVFRDRVARSSLSEIKADAELQRFALAGGEAAFGDNCAPCHGRGAQGAIGYPNLNDDDWLWGGKLDDIHKTLTSGIRSGHKEARENQMPAFGRDSILKPAEISDLTQFVLSLSGRAEDKAAVERGTKLFADNCVACHGEGGKGNRELGAPNLTDSIWLYGSEKEQIADVIRNARNGVMPAWQGRLDPVTIKQLAVYVHSLGGGE
ncbi:MAG: cytochrome-c oxidase, cbb3-type subunit III [Pseudomonadota bacterium]|nr:cytochrome-c oxidase, cbb3-type subunit III [Pseudomonadota bacterium]